MEKLKRKAVLITILISAFFTLIGIFVLGNYGFSLFVFTPVFIGFCPVLIVGSKYEMTLRESISFGLLNLLIAIALLLITAMEGVICVIMAIPIAFILTILGSFIAYKMNKTKFKNKNIAFWIILFSIPATSFVDSNLEPEILVVTTTIEIDANIEEVWHNVVEFPPLDEPDEFLFNYGIAYPISANIEGEGVGAIRYCNFSTGSFKEPITTWNAPTLLQFDVDESPQPMKELSYKEIDAPHLHDYFVSKKGEFRLIKISKNKTKLVGTTWYVNNMYPVFYWRLWSDYIIHKIHERVLNHIKVNSEN